VTFFFDTPIPGSAGTSPASRGRKGLRLTLPFSSPVYGGGVRKADGGGVSSVLCAVLLSITFLILTAACTVTSNELNSVALDTSAPIQSTTIEIKKYNESVCLKGKTYQGCCSKKLGIKDIRGARLLCNDGAESPSCTTDISTPLKGCCSDHGGVEGTRTDGTVTCKDGNISPSCYIGSCKTGYHAD
jgi:hypothetical protein